MFTKSYGLNCFREINEEIFSYAASHGLSCLEIHLGKTYITLESFTEERIEEINNLSVKYNVSIGIHNPYSVNASDIISFIRKADTKYIFKVIQLAKKLNAVHITAHIGNFYWFPIERWMRKKALNRFIKSMDSIIDLCTKCNTTFALENLVPLPHGSEYFYLGDNLNDFEYLFSKLNSDKFMFCLDTGHANVGEGVVPYIENFGYKIKVIHFHDNKGNDDNHLPVGEGTINWQEFASAFSNVNNKIPLISECRKIKPHEAATLLDNYFKLKNQLKS